METVCDHLRLLFLHFICDIVTLGVRFTGLIFDSRFISLIFGRGFNGLFFVLSTLDRFVIYRRIALFLSVSVGISPAPAAPRM